MSEAAIARKLVESILAKGYSISLEAEGEPFTDNSTDKDQIMRDIDASDLITIVIDEDIGWFVLIWGNGDDIISDYADNDICNEIYEEVSRATGI